MLTKNERLFNEWAGMRFPALKTFSEATGENYAKIRKVAERHKWKEKQQAYFADVVQDPQGDILCDNDLSHDIDKMIAGALRSVEMGLIRCTSISDIEKLTRIKDTLKQVEAMNSMSNLPDLVDAMAQSLIAEGWSSWDDIPDPRDEQQRSEQ